MDALPEVFGPVRAVPVRASRSSGFGSLGNRSQARKKGLRSLGRGAVEVSHVKMSEHSEPEPADPGIDVSGPIERLDEQECWTLLTQARFGRIALAAVGDLDIFPINFVVERPSLVFRTAEGTKLVESVITDLVAIEADDRDERSGVAWSVVAKGTPQVLERFDDIYLAQRLDIRPWVAGLPKELFVRVRVRSISGRRFHADRPDDGRD